MFTAEVGGLPGTILSYAGSPRTLGMGKAFTALANDVEAGYFNPAGLVQMDAQDVKLAHSMLYGDVKMEYIAYGLPTRQYGNFGLTLLSLWTTGVESRDPENLVWPSTYGYIENALLFSYGFSPVPGLAVGANLKFASKDINYRVGVGAGADLGVLIMAPRPLQFGIFLQNLVPPQMTLATRTEQFPTTIRLGAAARFYKDRVAVAFDLVKAGLDTVTILQPHGGFEFEIIPSILTARAGIDRNEISVGGGLKQLWGNFGLGVDYAFLMHHQSSFMLEPTHKLGLNLEFAGYRVWIQATPSLFSPTPEDKQNVLWMDVKFQTRRPIKRWQVLIRNNLSEVVKSFGSWESPPLRIPWDGLDEAGKLVPDGRYSYEIVLVDERNESMDREGFLTTIRTKGPTGRVEVERK
jgi:hypothetical protein